MRRLQGISIWAALGLLSLIPVAQAQTTNIDKGKTTAEMFTADCAVCHKSVKGLANGQNSLTLAGYLKDHYTTSREQASALAAYVLGSGGGAAEKPDRARTATQEPKAQEPKIGAPKPSEVKLPETRPAEAKSSAEAKNHLVAEPVKREETPAAAAKLEISKPEAAPKVEDSKPPQATASRTVKPEPESVAPPPMAVTAAPVAAPAPAEQSSVTARAPDADLNPAPSTEPAANDSAPVPRDNVPD